MNCSYDDVNCQLDLSENRIAWRGGGVKGEAAATATRSNWAETLRKQYKQ